MRWGQGFFRAWLLLSVIWIGLLGFIIGPKTYSWLWHAPQYDVAFSSGHRITFDTSKSHDGLAADVTRELQAEAARMKTGETPQQLSTKRDQLLTEINSRYETAGEQAQRAWLATFIPPLALLVLGLGIAWIGRGFRAATR